MIEPVSMTVDGVTSMEMHFLFSKGAFLLLIKGANIVISLNTILLKNEIIIF